MFPDAKWLDALKLPIKIKVAVFLSCGTLFVLFKKNGLSLGTLDQYIIPGLIISAVVFGVLTIVDVAAWCMKPITEKRRQSQLASRRAVRQRETEEQQVTDRALILKRLDSLSREESRYVAGALENETPTFYTYVHSPPVGLLRGKGLVWTTDEKHHQDHYPFSFHDFVWEEILLRRDEFLAKEKKYLDTEEAQKGSRRRSR